MAVVTSSYRSLNARWLWNLANEKKSLFVGVSKLSTEQTITVDGKPTIISDIDINDNDGNDAIDKSDFFVRAYADFVRESDNTDWDVQLLTRQMYGLDPYHVVDEHTFLDRHQYWKILTPEEALNQNCYNIFFNFTIKDEDHSQGNLFKGLRHFYVFDNLLYKNAEIAENIDFIKKDDTDPDYSASNFTAGNIIIIDDFVSLDVPNYFNTQIKYLISF